MTAQLEAIKARVKALGETLGVSKKMEPKMEGGGGEAMQMAAAPTPEKPAVTFADHVLPIFKERCVKCHNQDKAKGGLAVDMFDSLMEGGSSGEVIQPGSSGSSRLVSLIDGSEEPVMPPSGDPLTDEQLALIRQWIDLGAPADSDSKVMVAEAATATVSEDVFTAAAIVDGPPPMPEAELAVATPAPAAAVVARAVATNPRSPLVAMASYRQALLYDAETMTLLGALPFQEGEIHALTFSVNGEWLVAAGGTPGDKGIAVIWNVRTGERIGTYGEEYDTILAADLSPDHRMIALGGPSRLVRVYSVATGELAYKLDKHAEWIYAVKFTPDGEVLTTADRGGGMHLWQAANGRHVEELRGHNGAIHDLDYSADSNMLASAGADGTVRLWDTWKYNQIRSFNAHGGGTLSVDFNPANQIVSTGVDKQVKRWDTAGKNLSSYEALPDWGYQARFARDGAVVLAGSWNGQVSVWEAESGTKVADLSTNPAS
jgi:hypothetical protein